MVSVPEPPQDPRSRRLHLPNELLQNILKELREYQAPNNQSNLLSASLVCRIWEPSASALIWNHVVLRGSDALRRFIASKHASALRHPGVERALLVRILELNAVDWMNVEEEEFVVLIPQMETFRLWHRGSGRCFSGGLPMSRMKKMRMSWASAAITSKRGPQTEDPTLPTTPPQCIQAQVTGDPANSTKATEFCTLLVESIGTPIVESNLAGFENTGPSLSIPAVAEWPNLAILNCLFDEANSDPFFAKLVTAAPPLRCVTLVGEFDDEPSWGLVNLLRAFLGLLVNDKVLAILERQPPLTFSRFAAYGLPEDEASKEALLRFFRARGSNLQVLDLFQVTVVDSEVLECPTARDIGPRNPHCRQSAFIPKLKQALPNLRHFNLSPSKKAHFYRKATEERYRGFDYGTALLQNPVQLFSSSADFQQVSKGWRQVVGCWYPCATCGNRTWSDSEAPGGQRGIVVSSSLVGKIRSEKSVNNPMPNCERLTEANVGVDPHFGDKSRYPLLLFRLLADAWRVPKNLWGTRHFPRTQCITTEGSRKGVENWDKPKSYVVTQWV
ncbi:hypothetical protein BDK51DRAFT_34205 [Blyttiomyces helicus]|uniref:F-box domain-containing protein n=1 Tax=Blyttiomyces helicus TaxID=388810 RepID=A0A4V1ISV0_9FUNG|nr:hypothetical protein BDK51DRAFT_34205 [Blyttiomyces helicus]|eukprot:RKO94827.1 hypothetical protein BDK51DRAFT_34205 [Blyttiomyces helicus]